MRWPLLALPALLCSTGCAAFINASGTDLDSLHTKADVRKALGAPDASGVTDGQTYEDFHTHRKISEKWRGEGLLMAWVLALGFNDLIQVPIELFKASHQMIVGHDLRVIYEADGTVKTVLVNGGVPLGGRCGFAPNKTDPATEVGTPPKPTPSTAILE